MHLYIYLTSKGAWRFLEPNRNSLGLRMLCAMRCNSLVEIGHSKEVLGMRINKFLQLYELCYHLSLQVSRSLSPLPKDIIAKSGLELKLSDEYNIQLLMYFFLFQYFLSNLIGFIINFYCQPMPVVVVADTHTFFLICKTSRVSFIKTS